MSAPLKRLLLLAAFALNTPALVHGYDGFGRAIDEERVPVRPKLDPKRIINESNSFLKTREPEMNSEEYALYEKVVTMLTTNPEFAMRMLEAMKDDKEPPSPAFQFILGNAYYAAGQNEQAEASYRNAVERFPTFLRAWNNLGVLYYTTSRFTDAIRCFAKSVELGDKDATTLGLFGYSLEKEGNIVSAEMAYMQALASDPNNSDWKEGLLRIYMQGKQYVRAESLVKSLIKERPTDTRFWLIYANILVSDSRKLEAIGVLEVAANASIAGANEFALLGDLYAEQHLTAEAASTYRRLGVLDANMGEQRIEQFAQTLIAERNYDEAARALDTALKGTLSERGRLRLVQARADLLVSQEKWPLARAEIENVLKDSPLDGRALLTLGATYVGEENWDRAVLAYESAYRIPATTYRASLQLANLELKQGHYAKCAEYLTKALSIEKTDGVEVLLARIKALIPPEERTS